MSINIVTIRDGRNTGYRKFANRNFANWTFASIPPEVSPIGESPLNFDLYIERLSPIGKNPLNFCQYW
jgi:hypothetical protein